MVDTSFYKSLLEDFAKSGVRLVAVSKFQPVAEIQALYDLGQRDFGENYVQELVEKAAQLPPDIRWHFIGHLQKNKAKYIAPFVHLIQSVDSLELLAEIEKRAAKEGRVIDVLLELKIAGEHTKQGIDENEILRLLEQLDAQSDAFQSVRVCGLMAMASFTQDEAQIAAEFSRAQTAFAHLKATCFFRKSHFNTLSMGMSGDYLLALQHASTLVRIGSLLFGERPVKGETHNL